MKATSPWPSGEAGGRKSLPTALRPASNTTRSPWTLIAVDATVKANPNPDVSASWYRSITTYEPACTSVTPGTDPVTS